MYNFIGHESWKDKLEMPDNRGYFEKNACLYGEVKILRPLMFFHQGQKDVKVENLAKFFTDAAIFSFINDHFITVEEIKTT